MNKGILKKAVDSITVDQELVEKTKARMKDETTINAATWSKRFIAVGACMAVFIMGVLLYNKLPLYNQGKVADKPIISANDTLLPEVKSNYVAFNATEFSPVKCPSPRIPRNYQQLKNESSTVLIVTIKDIGVYRRTAEQYNPKASFGTYIYTAKIDKILSGAISKNVNDLIPIAEQAWADPTFNGKEIVKWNFTPYSCRADNVRNMETEKQYVVFLSVKDETGCYQIPFNGFGIFPVDYINDVASKTTVDEIKGEYNYVGETTNVPLKDANLYRLSSLYIKEQFLNK